MTYWAVVNTHPQAEGKALKHCQRQGFTCYSPRERYTVIQRGRRVEIDRHLFPRYLFVWIERKWHCLFGTIGVSRVLMHGDKPGRVEEGFVEKMIASEIDGAVILPAKTALTVGSLVTIEGGLFHGQRGLYQGQTSRQREVVLLEKLGRVELRTGRASFSYKRRYDELIAMARRRRRGSEQHHVVPLVLNGPDEPSNIVRLTPSEHVEAHWLLMKITRGEEYKKMHAALRTVLNTRHMYINARTLKMVRDDVLLELDGAKDLRHDTPYRQEALDRAARLYLASSRRRRK